MLSMYLAGAIRDSRLADIEWRETFAEELHPYIAGNILRILSPLGGKVYNEQDRSWTVSGIKSSANLIVSHDFWCVDKADIGIFNLLSIADKYPLIGTFMEFGRSTARPMLRYVIWPEGETGHTHSSKMYQVHPFIVQNATAVFPSVAECLRFLIRHIPVLAGIKPQYDPDGRHDAHQMDMWLKHYPTDTKGQA